MEKLLRFLSGYVLILAEGEQTERFLNLCRARGIIFRDVCRCGGRSIRGKLSVKDFFLLRPARFKTKVHIRVLEKHGLPFFFFRSKKRKAFFLGIFLCLGLLAFLSTRIWNIHVEGNQKNTTQEILGFLEEEGVVHGMAKSRVDCGEIAASIRRAYPEITWVSARIRGTRLLVDIQEGILREEEEDSGGKPCSLAADLSGTIVKMVTRSGVPKMKPGDTCKKGDILVSGRLDILNDSQEVVRSEYVHADADVYILREIPYYRSFPLERSADVPTGKVRRGFYLKAGAWYFSLEPSLDPGWQRTAEEYPLRVTENFLLPISLGKIRLTQYRAERKIDTPEEARALARQRLQKFEEKLIEKGLFISANNVKIDTDETACTSSGRLEVIEKIGKEVPVGAREEAERTSEDGEQYH